MTRSAELYSPCVGERQMLFEHLKHLDAHDLLVLDRGYPARGLIAYLTQQRIAFSMRVDALGFAAVKTFLRSGLSEQIVSIAPSDAPDCRDYACLRTATPVRLVRVVAPNARLRVVMTSLPDNTVYPAADLAALYHARWRVEQALKRLKHRLALENTSGLSWLAA